MKPVSDHLFIFENQEKPRLRYERCSAKDLGLSESWLRDSIFDSPDLVIAPCRVAGLTDDDWYPWLREFGVEVGQIDVVLLSSQGRVAVIETKLANNPELRRRVLAQVLDYLAHLPDRFGEALPEVPLDESGQPVAEWEDIVESVAQGDILVIIASDEIDPRVAKLSRTLLSDNLVKQWDLALVDVALYRPIEGSGPCIIVPHLRNLIQSEPRQVVRVVVEGETPSARVEVKRITEDDITPVRQKWDESRFFRYLEAETVPKTVRELAIQLRDLAHLYPKSVSLVWGTGKSGSMVVKRRNGGLIEVFGSGEIKFRPRKFARALGEEVANEYRTALKQLIPQAMSMQYPRIPVRLAEKVAPELFGLIQRILQHVEQSGA